MLAEPSMSNDSDHQSGDLLPVGVCEKADCECDEVGAASDKDKQPPSVTVTQVESGEMNENFFSMFRDKSYCISESLYYILVCLAGAFQAATVWLLDEAESKRPH